MKVVIVDICLVCDNCFCLNGICGSEVELILLFVSDIEE